MRTALVVGRIRFGGIGIGEDASQIDPLQPGAHPGKKRTPPGPIKNWFSTWWILTSWQRSPFDFKVDDAFCALGTTIAKAGSKDAFTRVDHDYVIAFAEKALSMGAKGCYVVSSMGANPKSRIFYNRVKGEMEEKLKTLNFPRVGHLQTLPPARSADREKSRGKIFRLYDEGARFHDTLQIQGNPRRQSGEKDDRCGIAR